MSKRDDFESPSIEPISRRHKKDSFESSQPSLDYYLKKQANQDVKRKVAVTYVAIDGRRCVIGYYTLSSFSIRLPELPAAAIKRLPKYPQVPATLLGRLAVDESHQGIGLGEHLLMDALARALRAASQIASYAVIVDAIDSNAVSFYRRYDFAPFPENGQRLFLPMSTIARAFS